VFDAEVLPVTEAQVADIQSRHPRKSDSDSGSEASEHPELAPTQSMQRLHQAKPKNLSFSSYEQKRIERENDRILRNLVDIQVRQPKFEPSPAGSRPHHAAINRKKQEEKIKKENYQILNRLMNTKSTMKTRAPAAARKAPPPRKARANGGIKEGEGPSFPSSHTPSPPSEPSQDLTDPPCADIDPTKLSKAELIDVTQWATG